ncbi:MAG: hypothetical protein FJ297_07275 [Planctomycetes bacterium]|nr:hypothetical protein [Planctomycetota bacterium]
MDIQLVVIKTGFIIAPSPFEHEHGHGHCTFVSYRRQAARVMRFLFSERSGGAITRAARGRKRSCVPDATRKLPCPCPR